MVLGHIKILHIAPADAKVFALAIQSVGMGAAAAVIVAARIPVEWAVLRWAGLGGLAGLILGAFLIGPIMSPPLTRMVFTVLQASFALALVALSHSEPQRHERLPRLTSRERGILLIAGAGGGVASSLVGSGLDIIVFSVTVLLFRLSEKVATPTSVVLMAGNAIAGFAIYALVLDDFTPQIQGWWLAAIPVVVIGAPLGALVCSRMDRLWIVRVLIGLIGVEVVTSLLLVPLSGATLVVSGAAFIVFAGAYTWMYRQTLYRPNPADPEP